MESRIKGFNAFYANIRTTRFPTEMINFYYIQKGSRMKAVAIDEGTKPISLGFDADRPAGDLNFDFLFANRIGLRKVVQLVEERKGEVVCDDITFPLPLRVTGRARLPLCWPTTTAMTRIWQSRPRQPPTLFTPITPPCRRV